MMMEETVQVHIHDILTLKTGFDDLCEVTIAIIAVELDIVMELYVLALNNL